MKISKYSLAAVIPTTQYGNLQPKIELEDVELEEAAQFSLAHIQELYGRFSEKGELKDKGKQEQPVQITTSIQKKSFNEEGVVVDYDDIPHTYHYKGKELTSATGIVSKFYKGFNVEAVSKASARAWGVDPEDVKGLWSSNGDLAAGFGSVVHAALEHYDNYKHLGKTVSDHKGDDDNYAMPKHPLLRSIIEEFEDLYSTDGEIVPEALITDVESGYCGHADRVLILDRKKKICRVQDYKINIGSEEEKSSLKAGKPFDKLPKNKITKYQLQMSVYANMLQKSGWMVEGLDVFVYEDKWKHHELEVLDVLYNE